MCGIFSWISGCVLAIVNRPMELRWPNSGGCSRRNHRASSRCLQRAGAFFFVYREGAARSILALSTSVIT